MGRGLVRALDICCGKGGWTDALKEQGFETWGIDLHAQPDYKGIFRKGDVLSFWWSELDGFYLDEECLGHFDFICASTPCEEFSIHGLKCFHPNPKFPAMGIKLFTHVREVCERSGVPYVMENVRSAEKFIGKAVNHCGPFYLWGNAVPAIFPKEAYKVNKGTKFGLDKDGTRNQRKLHDQYYRTGSNSKARAEHTATVAMIPKLVSRCVAETALAIVDVNRSPVAQPALIESAWQELEEK